MTEDQQPNEALARTQIWPHEISASRPTEPPTVTGYEVLGELGRGGMGVVYKARQLGLDRLVALKMILHADYASVEQRERFQRESQALAQLQHENIVHVYGIGEVKDKPYFSLELVEGGSLEKHLAGKPQDNRESARMIHTLARAIHVAHQAGIIHRDLKPANVLLAGNSKDVSDHDPNEPVPLSELIPKITDFGLAKKIDESVQTRTGAIMGTPAYSAPEQAKGKQSEVGPATDVYALGAILYEMLTGRPPFTGVSAVDVLTNVLEEEPIPPRLLNTRVNRDLETICLKCLEKSPKARYSSAQELAEDLESFLQGDSISARSYNLIDRLARTLERGHLDAKFLNWSTLLMQFSGVVLITYVVIYFLLRERAGLLWIQTVYGVMVLVMGGLFLRHRKGNVFPTSSWERQLWSIWIGYFLATLAINLVGSRMMGEEWTYEGKAFPFHFIIGGLAFFGMGSQFWGGFYVFGFSFWCVGILMTLDPRFAPMIHGTSWSLALLLMGLRLRKLSEVEDSGGESGFEGELPQDLIKTRAEK